MNCGHCADWRAGRIAAKRAAAAVTGIQELDRFELQPVPGAAPIVTVRDGSGGASVVPMVLSLSHRDGRAVAAASMAPGGLGVDLEHANAVRGAHVRYFLAANERQALKKRTPAELWTLKEAAWKAVQCGNTASFTELELGFDGAGAVETIAFRGQLRSAQATLFHLWLGYAVAVVWVPEVLP